MSTVSWKELSIKEVIALCDGERLGYFCDFEMEVQSGCIRCFFLPDNKCFSFSKKARYIVKLDWIEKIGEDVILVKRYERIEKDGGK